MPVVRGSHEEMRRAGPGQKALKDERSKDERSRAGATVGAEGLSAGADATAAGAAEVLRLMMSWLCLGDLLAAISWLCHVLAGVAAPPTAPTAFWHSGRARRDFFSGKRVPPGRRAARSRSLLCSRPGMPPESR
jgi:hypothetical protein